MRKLPFFIGLGFIAVQAIIAGVFLISQISISEASLNMWALLIVSIPTNLTAFTLMIYGLMSE